MSEGVDHQQNGEVDSGLVQMENVLDEVSNLSASCTMPLAWRHLEPWQTPDSEPVLLGPVQHPVIELRIGGHLEVDLALELVMTIFDECHAIIMVSNILTNLGELGLTAQTWLGQNDLGLIEQMEDVVEARDRVKEHAVRHKILAREGWHETKVLRNICRKSLRKPGRNLCQVTLIPKWTLAIQGRCQQDLKSIKALNDRSQT